MVCLACQAFSAGTLCANCERSLRPAPDRLLPGGIRLVAGYSHEGAAKTLVHHLKYRGITEYAELAAELVVGRVPNLPLVPIPRALSRRMKYGVDPARAIAVALGRRSGAPVVDTLAHPWHTPKRAGSDHSRPVRPFRVRRFLRTTGATALAAVAAIGSDLVGAVAAANVVPDTSNLGPRITRPEPGGTELGKRADS
jgi:hypothetical protein